MIHAASLVAHALGWPDAQAPRIVPTEVSSALRARAERLVSTTDGVFERSDGRPLAYLITDGMLMRVQQAVDDTGDAAEPKLSGLARKRLMAWVVVDVVCSPVVLPKASADKAGGRIWMQAKRVSAMVTTTSDTATSNRDAAHAAAAADPSLEAGLAAELAEIDATEQVALDRLLTEVYTGFTELKSVPAPSVEFEAPTADRAPPRAPPAPSAAPQPAPRCDGVRYKHLLPVPNQSDLLVPAIPPDLSASLSSDALQMLCSQMSTVMAGAGADEWWSFGLPTLACNLARQLANAETDLSREKALCKKAWGYAERLHVRHQAELTEVRADYELTVAKVVNSELISENEELRRQLSISQAETAVLAKVLGQKGN